MGEVMTTEEIYERFDSEWVLLENPEIGESQQVRGGRVLWHSRDRDEVYEKLLALRLKHSAILYTGKIPQEEDMVIVL